MAFEPFDDGQITGGGGASSGTAYDAAESLDFPSGAWLIGQNARYVIDSPVDSCIGTSCLRLRAGLTECVETEFGTPSVVNTPEMAEVARSP